MKKQIVGSGAIDFCFFFIVILFFSNQASAQYNSTNLTLHQIQTHDLTYNPMTNTVSLEKGGCAIFRIQSIGADALIKIFGPDHKLVYKYSQMRFNGPLPVKIEADLSGYYDIEVSPFEPDRGGATYWIQLLKSYSAYRCDSASSAQVRNDPQIIASIQQHAFPVTSCKPGTAEDDLFPMKKILQNIQLVGLGEQTYGTSEFFQFNHRMVQFLVEDMGYTVFTMEDGYTEGLAMNQYILNGTGNLDSLLKSMHPVWNTEEMVDMINWMKGYNETASAEDKIKFYGFDPLDKNVADSILIFFEKFIPDQSAKVNGILAGFNTFSDSTFTKRSTDLRWIKSNLLQNKTSLIKTAGSEIFNHAMMEASIIEEQTIMAMSRAISPYKRDESMAKNISELVHDEKPETKFIIWSHNDHISTAGDDVHPKQMGYFLRQLFGNNYYALGLLFDQGSFRAIRNTPENGIGNFTTFTLPPASLNYLEYYFASADTPMFLLDLKSISKPKAMVDWMSTLSTMRSIGTLYYEKDYESFNSEPVFLKNDYDGIFFIKKATSAHAKD